MLEHLKWRQPDVHPSSSRLRRLNVVIILILAGGFFVASVVDAYVPSTSSSFFLSRTVPSSTGNPLESPFSISVRSSSLRNTRISASKQDAPGVTSTTTTTTVPSSTTATEPTTTVVTFSPYSRLMRLAPGEFEVSEPIRVPFRGGGSRDSSDSATDGTLQFCVKFYPKGGGHASESTVLGKGKQRTKSGFGMSYKVLPFFSNVPDKVGVYLQYLPHQRDVDGASPSIVAVDASFGLRMVGRQRVGPKFDVEFRSGMRFVSSRSDTNLKEGRANDFGAHLMQTDRLPDFLGCAEGLENDDDPPVQIQVSILVHNVMYASLDNGSESQSGRSSSPPSSQTGNFWNALVPRDIRGDDRSTSSTHDEEQVRVGRIVVPVLSRLEQRPRLFELGAYPGVEYRIMRIIDPKTDRDIFYSRPGADYELKPAYPLVKQLERPWPVRVNERELPRLYTPAMYNTVSAVASLFTAVTGLLTAFVISQAVSLFFIPSHSMDPTLEVGDVLLVDKVTPRLFRQGTAQVGDVVLFHPPGPLQDFVSRSGGRNLGDRDLFVKRVAAVPGDVVTVQPNGDVLVNSVADSRNRNLCDGPGVEPYVKAGDLAVRRGEVVVLGDCSKVSIDSRVWGPLPLDNVVGRPLLRLWPLSRVGPIPALPQQDVNVSK